MKNTICLAFTLLFSVLGFAAEKITLSGMITNTTDNKLVIEGELFEKIIVLKADGSFNETFEIFYEGSYALKTKNNQLPIFLNKNSNLNITADDADFKKSLRFDGNGATENTYWLQKQKITGSTIKFKKINNSELNAFSKNEDEISNKQWELFIGSKNLDSSFVDYEKRNIAYSEEIRKSSFLKLSAYFSSVPRAKNDSIVQPKPIPIDTLINLESEADFLFSFDYKRLIIDRLKDKISKVNTSNEKFTAKYYLPEIKKINSPYIKNHLLQLITDDINADNPDLDSTYNEMMGLSSNEKFKKRITAKYLRIKKTIPCTPSPSFDYENFKGGKTSLESLKGKYIYLSIWTTWCSPCLNELSDLEKTRQLYKNKNIVFVNISIDDKREYFDWRKIVTKRKLGGIQLFADKSYKSDFVKTFESDKVQRFIIIDPAGNLVSVNAPRPSDPELIEKFKELGL